MRGNVSKMQTLEIPFCSAAAKDIITQLLQKDADMRLGKNGGIDIMMHPFFDAIDFDKLYQKQLIPPFKINGDEVIIRKLRDYEEEKTPLLLQQEDLFRSLQHNIGGIQREDSDHYYSDISFEEESDGDSCEDESFSEYGLQALLTPKTTFQALQLIKLLPTYQAKDIM